MPAATIFDNSGLAKVLQFTEEVHAENKLMMVSTTSIPHRNITNALDYVMVYDGGRQHFF
eukprot:Awhi_evm1s8695